MTIIDKYLRDDIERHPVKLQADRHPNLFNSYNDIIIHSAGKKHKNGHLN